MTDYTEIDKQIEADLRGRLEAVTCTLCLAEIGAPCTSSGRPVPGPRVYHRTRYAAADVLDTSNAVILRSFGASPARNRESRVPTQPSKGEQE